MAKVQGGSNTGTIVGIIIAVVVLVIIGFAIYAYMKKNAERLATDTDTQTGIDTDASIVINPDERWIQVSKLCNPIDQKCGLLPLRVLAGATIAALYTAGVGGLLIGIAGQKTRKKSELQALISSGQAFETGKWGLIIKESSWKAL